MPSKNPSPTNPPPLTQPPHQPRRYIHLTFKNKILTHLASGIYITADLPLDILSLLHSIHHELRILVTAARMDKTLIEAEKEWVHSILNNGFTCLFFMPDNGPLLNLETVLPGLDRSLGCLDVQLGCLDVNVELVRGMFILQSEMEHNQSSVDGDVNDSGNGVSHISEPDNCRDSHTDVQPGQESLASSSEGSEPIDKDPLACYSSDWKVDWWHRDSLDEKISAICPLTACNTQSPRPTKSKSI